MAGHKGQPDKVRAKGRVGRRRRLKGCRGRGTLAKEKPPILGMVQRSGELILKMLPNVQQATIKPIIATCVAQGALIYTDEYNIYGRLVEWGYGHKTVSHSIGEYARTITSLPFSVPTTSIYCTGCSPIDTTNM